MPGPLVIVAIAAALLAIAFLVTAAAALRRRRLCGTVAGGTVALLLFALAALMATISVATQGYRALTREELAATIVVQPTGPRRFTARFTFPDGAEATYALAGEQIYVDAHILKWKPIANILGLHTAYELDRVGGRYLEIADERDSTRTIFSLAEDKPIDMFAVRRRWAVFTPLLDAEYGSGTFVTADRPDTLQVLVSTTGLLLRHTGR